MSEFKYLSDGRKVSVVGKINKTEYIVQEVFITEGGDEIPSGENFTTKSLHNKPLLSWKEKEIDKIDLRYSKKKEEIKKIELELNNMRKERVSHSKIIKSNLRQIEEIKDLELGILPDVIARNIKYVCGAGYNWYEVKSFDEFISIRSDYDEGVKLISVHIKDSGFSYRVGNYSDGSGSSQEYKFFNDKEEVAIYLNKRAKECIEKGSITLWMLDSISGYVDIPGEIRKKIVDKEIKIAEEAYQKELKRITENRDRAIRLKRLK